MTALFAVVSGFLEQIVSCALNGTINRVITALDGGFLCYCSQISPETPHSNTEIT